MPTPRSCAIFAALSVVSVGHAVAQVTPGDPGGDIRFTVDSTRDRRDISPFIYGSNFNDLGRGLTLERSGGNRMTAYNWENNASNAGADWHHQNDGFISSSDVPGEPIRNGVHAAGQAGKGVILTIPIQGYVAADKNGGGDVNQTPDYLNVRFHQSKARKGSPFSLSPDTTDKFVYQDEFVNWVEQSARHSVEQPIFYALDNEPDLWSHTHPRIHPNPATYAEVAEKNIEYAAAIKDVAPDALVFGAVNYGWNGYRTLQDAPDRNGRDFHEFYLAEMKQAEEDAGRRLIDVLDIHWYPEARGNDSTGTSRRVTFDADGANDPGVAHARMQAPRSLWDETYTETSWITQFSTNGPIKLLRRVQEDIDTFYPGTKIGITEYNFGGTDHISGAVAQADALGIFGREGVFAANFWALSGDNDFAAAAFSMYRDFDGNLGRFLDTSIAAETTDIEKTAIHASIDPNDPSQMVLILINRSGEDVDAGLAITHSEAFDLAQVYQLTGASPQIVRLDDLQLTGVNALRYTMPAYSVTTLRLLAVPEPAALAPLGAALLLAKRR